MAKVIKNKKGILNTIMLTAIALSLLALSVVILHARQDLSSSVRELALVERLNNQNSAVSWALLKIFNETSDIAIDVQPLSVSFTETIDVNKGEYFSDQMYNYEAFIESTVANIRLDVSQIASTVPLAIMPHNIVYSHPHGLGGNMIRVAPVDANFAKYSITVSSIDSDIDLSSCTSNFIPGGKQIYAKIIGPNKENCFYGGSFDPTAANNLTAQSKNKKEIQIRVLANTNGTLEVEDINSIKVDVTTGITLEELNNSNIDILYPDGNLLIDLRELGAIKNGSIKLR